MFLRSKFVTNSSSTCFIAWGVYAEIEDKERFNEEGTFDIDSDGPVGIIQSRFDEDRVLLYWLDTKRSASEYSVWQDIECPPIDELVRKEALEHFDRIADKYGLYPIPNPHWGFYNSGH